MPGELAFFAGFITCMGIWLAVEWSVKNGKQ